MKVDWGDKGATIEGSKLTAAKVVPILIIDIVILIQCTFQDAKEVDVKYTSEAQKNDRVEAKKPSLFERIKERVKVSFCAMVTL